MNQYQVICNSCGVTLTISDDTGKANAYEAQTWIKEEGWLKKKEAGLVVWYCPDCKRPFVGPSEYKG